jgi:hypothetical protein
MIERAAVDCFSYQLNAAFLMYFKWSNYLVLMFTLTTSPFTDTVMIPYVNYFLNNFGLSIDDGH